MAADKKIPTLYEWAGSMPAFENLTNIFYSKVLQDPLLEPVFKHMSPQHQQHVAHFIAEVFGGPTTYSEGEGSHYQMVQKHLGKHLTEQHRKRWVELLLQTADELGMPDDPEFRSAFVGYLEWGTRIAVINSRENTLEMDEQQPMPRWGWGETGGPYVP
ncbi:group II truncated hemoglobin [Chitinophaga qingshengii]|uniref:Globin n=1 Tax=Chitinophaga qingshengii TaxID=1569794 RepID=A0ABR7THU1_9BACT|nr:group II truncated hemoglobin [Chitinophaga qingshengii]MBC9929523.1 globin [Chitinophaga qingshengii]